MIKYLKIYNNNKIILNHSIFPMRRIDNTGAIVYVLNDTVNHYLVFR